MATTQNIGTGASAHDQKQNANIKDLAALASAASLVNNESEDYRLVFRGGELHVDVLNRDLWPRTVAHLKTTRSCWIRISALTARSSYTARLRTSSGRAQANQNGEREGWSLPRSSGAIYS